MMHTPCPDSTRSDVLERVRNWGDGDAWRIFFQTYRPLIHGFSIKSGLNDDEAQEVAQDTLIEVARRIKNGEYDRRQGSFRAWLYRLTKWRITNQFNKRLYDIVPLERLAMSESLDLKDLATTPDESSSIWEEDWRKALFDAAMERLRKTMKPKHIHVLHALVIHGWPVPRVARVLRMSRGQVYLIKLRGMIRLKKEIALLEKAEIY